VLAIGTPLQMYDGSPCGQTASAAPPSAAATHLTEGSGPACPSFWPAQWLAGRPARGRPTPVTRRPLPSGQRDCIRVVTGELGAGT